MLPERHNRPKSYVNDSAYSVVRGTLSTPMNEATHFAYPYGSA